MFTKEEMEKERKKAARKSNGRTNLEKNYMIIADGRKQVKYKTFLRV